MSDLSGTWVEDARGLVISLMPANGVVLGSLQFGSVPSPTTEIYVTIAYVAGYGNTFLTAPATAGATTLTVDDPTGFVPPQTSVFGTQIGASVARIWEPGSEEAVKVSQSYVTGANPLVLASTLANAHNTGVQVSEFPPEVRQAVISYAIALLLREDAGEDMPFPGSPGPAARRSSKGGKGGGLISEAEKMLEPYRRVR
jgi:hypothetical protein